jgi:transposase-like protein
MKIRDLSRPKIALHKNSNVMKEINHEYLRRSQKDYSMSFKLSVVSEIERGEVSVTGARRKYGIQGKATVINWLRKYGTFDWENQTPSNMPKSKDQKIVELEHKIKLLEKQKAFLEKQAENSDKKAVFFDMMIELAEKEFNIPIRKNFLPEQSTNSAENIK